MIILGIETSCDDTALALIETRPLHESAPSLATHRKIELHVIDSLVHSQAELHSAYGGVYPNLAKREHGKNLVPLLHKLLIQSGEALKEIALHESSLNKGGAADLSASDFEIQVESFKKELNGQNPELLASLSGADFLEKIPPIDAIAVTEGPGLEPALWVGIMFARFLGEFWNIPIIPVNHMEGHVVGSLLEDDKPYGTWQKLKAIEFPAITLLISGGHTELVKVESIGSYEIVGQTKDDAVGEAFDKVARLLGLPYPGGPHISKLAYEAAEAERNGTEDTPKIPKLPRPMIASGDLDFSFSGLKTAVLYAIGKHGALTDSPEDNSFRKAMAREFEEAVADTLDSKLRAAIEKTSAKSVIIGGGVSANRRLRKRFEKTAEEFGIPLFLPSRHISGDNALMIAIAGALNGIGTEKKELKAQGTKRLGSH